MIGRLIGGYEQGRDDARAGRDQRSAPRSSPAARAYLLGFRDERRRMLEERRLAQAELFEERELPHPQTEAFEA